MRRTLLHIGIGLGVAALATAGVTTARPAAADAGTLSGCHDDGKHYEVCFTDPRHDKGKVIEHRLGRLVDSAHRGDTIRIALFKFNRKPLAKKVAAANDRGVNVKLVLDAGQVKGTPGYQTLKSRGVPMTLCTTGGGSCLGTHINHNKFFLFDIDGHKSVAQTSFNVANGSLKLYNNMVRVTGDAKLYDFYLAYWQRLHDKTWRGWTNDDRHRKGSLATKAYVFPRKTGDPVLGVLRNVTDCREHDAKIYLAESIFDHTRPAVRHRLAVLHEKKKCNVKVVVQQAEDEQWVQAPTGGYDLPNAKVRHIKLHHKFIVIDAKYNGHWQRVVFTGSHNLNKRSLRSNDEAMLRVRNPFVYQQFRRHFLDIYRIAGRG